MLSFISGLEDEVDDGISQLEELKWGRADLG